MNPIRFSFTVDDVVLKDFSSVEGFLELLEFLKKQRIPGTFFVVPFNQDIPLYERPGWVSALKKALSEGHELQLHGLRHQAFEWGIPPDFIMAYEHKERERLERERAEIEGTFTVAAFKEKLARGIEIFTRALGHRPTGFRAPYASTHPNLFQALAECGFTYDSSLIVNPKGWRYIVQNYTPGITWNKDVSPLPRKYHPGLVEIPIMAEYTWFLKEEDIERHYQLIKEDLDKISESGGVMVPVCHVGPVTGVNRAGLKVYERLLAYAREKNNVSFCTLTECNPI
jgi:peptidoglycan/xylan/chitin deacetylase (PgdA/CDA1 family)